MFRIIFKNVYQTVNNNAYKIKLERIEEERAFSESINPIEP